MTIKIDSTTDSNEAVLAALGKLESKQSEVEEKQSESSETPDEKVEESETSKSDSDQSDEDAEDQDDSDNDESKDDSSKPKKKGGFKKRIERFQKQLSEKDQELAYWREQALKGSKGDKPEQKPEIEAKSDAKPKVDDFDSIEAYTEALTDWKISQKQKEFERKEIETKAKAEFKNQFDSFQSKVAEFSKTQDDFNEVIEDVDDIPLSVGLQESILTSDVGPQVMYELAKNREELERINRLSPIAQAREIGKIEARLGEKNQKKPEAKVSKAPAPVSPVGTKGSLKTTKSPDEMTFQEYKKWREQNK